jgi:hypothetical protein
MGPLSYHVKRPTHFSNLPLRRHRLQAFHFVSQVDIHSTLKVGVGCREGVCISFDQLTRVTSPPWCRVITDFALWEGKGFQSVSGTFRGRSRSQMRATSKVFMFVNLRHNIGIVFVCVLCGFTSLISINAGVCVCFVQECLMYDLRTISNAK